MVIMLVCEKSHIWGGVRGWGEGGGEVTSTFNSSNKGIYSNIWTFT